MNLFASIAERLRRARTTDSLRQLDDHILRDIGLSRADLRQIATGALRPEHRNFSL